MLPKSLWLLGFKPGQSPGLSLRRDRARALPLHPIRGAAPEPRLRLRLKNPQAFLEKGLIQKLIALRAYGLKQYKSRHTPAIG